MKEMNTKEFLAIAILVKNEADRIEELLTFLTKIQNIFNIFIFNDNSTDHTLEKIIEIKKKIDNNNLIKYHTINFLENSTTFSEKRNFIHAYLMNKVSWVFFIDIDERPDPWFLLNAHIVIGHNPDIIAYKFPRINLPNGINYPDYQVRLINIKHPIQWKRAIHEVPMIERENRTWYNLHDFIGTKTLNDSPILHLPRIKNKKRSWW